MEISNRLRQRFCKDNKINIQLFVEPYFSERLKLIGEYETYTDFLKLIEDRFNGNEEAYFAEYNRIKDDIINYIKDSEAFKALNSDNMNLYASKYNLPQSDVYKEPNVMKHFISIDIQKANFSTLVNYSMMKNLSFYSSFNYKDFMRQFTDIEHVINSKYIRQVVFGNCNPKRQVTYEKYVTENIIASMIEENILELNDIANLTHDEIIIKAEEMTINKILRIKEYVDNVTEACSDEKLKQGKLTSFTVPLKFEYFKLGRVEGTDAFIKTIIEPESGQEIGLDIKGASPTDFILVHKTLNGLEITENDLVLMSDKRLAKYLKAPEIKIIR